MAKKYNKCKSGPKITEYIVFSALLLTSIYFLINMVEEYLSGNTYFDVSKQPIRREDLPTATVCFLASTEFNYGRDFTLQTLAIQGDNVSIVSLAEGSNEYNYHGRRMKLLRQLVVRRSTPFMRRSCISLDMRLQENFYMNAEGKTAHYLGTFIITLSKNIDTEPIHDALLYLTSEENSFGAVYLKWFDGKAEPFRLHKGGYNTVQIPTIRRYEYLEGTCQHTSFYECVGSNFKHLKECYENGSPCSPYSIPNNVPRICQRGGVIHQCKKSYWSLWGKCMKKKPCRVQEYEMQEVKEWSGKGNSSTEDILRSIDERLDEDSIKNLLEGHQV